MSGLPAKDMAMEQRVNKHNTLDRKNTHTHNFCSVQNKASSTTQEGQDTRANKL